MRRSEVLKALARRNGWAVGLLLALVLLLLFTKLVQPNYGTPGFMFLSIAVLPVAFAAAAQGVIIIAGGIDLSIGSMMALTSVVAAVLMNGQSEAFGVGVVLGVLLLGLVLGAINGGLVVLTRVPDIIVTLAMLFVWWGIALIVLPIPGGGSAAWLKGIGLGFMTLEFLPEALGFLRLDFLPKALVVLAIVVVLIWIPVQRSRFGLWFYAIGSNQLAAFRSGVPVGRAKVLSYMLGGLFASMGGLSLTATTGIGTPVPGPDYTLLSVAAAVLGGVSLAGGRGGLFGPIVAMFVLQLLRNDLTFLQVDPNMATVANGLVLVGVVMLGSVIQLRRNRA